MAPPAASLHRDRRVPCTCGAALVIAMAAAISLRTEAAAQEVDGFGMPVAYARVPGSQPESPRLGSWALRKPMRLSFATYNIRSIMDRRDAARFRAHRPNSRCCL